MSKPNRQAAVCDFITTHYLEYDRLRFDTVSGKIQIRKETQGASEPNAWVDLTNADINDMVCTIAQEADLAVTSREVMSVLQSHTLPHVHPLRAYLGALAPYTPEQGDWIDDLAMQVKIAPQKAENTDPEAAQTLWRTCFKKWFVAMVASWLHDDVVNHQVLVLIGRQGIYKTTWLEHLIPPELRQYSCKMASSRELNKDDRMRIAEFGLIAMDEIDAMSPRELNVLKSVITATDVNERQAYAYTKERRVRLASFCASGNKVEFLTDMTGNRRWLPFEIESIQNPFFTTLPYPLLYAQAVYLVEQGFNYWFDQDDIRILEAHNEEFREQLNEEQLLSVYFDVPATDSPSARFMTTAEISDKLVTYGSIKHPMPLSTLGLTMKKAGYQAIRKGKQRARGWLVYERSSDEIQVFRRP